MTLMVALYFGIGFITALNDILVPHFKDLFHLSNVLALLVQFCFFGAYFVMSLPSGWIVGRIGYKAGIMAALSTMGCGLLLFVPASIVISYPLFLFALFVVGSGLALLQVAINPYVGALGSPETAASRLNLCGFFNSFATTVAPKVGAAFIFIAAGASAAQLAQSVRLPYVFIACFTFLLAIATRFVPLPDVIEKRIETSAAQKRADGSAWQFTHLRLGAVAIFTYVGAEVAIGSILINFLGQPSMGSMSHADAARFVSLLGRRDGGPADRLGRAAQNPHRTRVGSRRHGRVPAGRHRHLRPWSGRALGRRLLRPVQLRDVALHLSAFGERAGQVHQRRLRHSGDDGGRRGDYPAPPGRAGRPLRLPAQLRHRAAVLRVPDLLRARWLPHPPARISLAAQLCSAARRLSGHLPRRTRHLF
jgi:MFS family permease